MCIKTLQDLRDYCNAKAGVKEDFPFDQTTLVFKVMGKMFALCGIDSDPLAVNLKCEPELAELLREKYEALISGYHMNKKHWNTLTIDGEVPDDEVRFLIDMSYDLVVKGLQKKDKEALEKM